MEGTRQDQVWYFAYGSNMDPERFGARVGAWAEWRRGTLRGWELAFSGEVESEGGGGAIVEPAVGGVVHGVAFLITRKQLAEMDRVEFDPSRDREGLGHRTRVTVESDGDRLEAEVYTIRSGGRRREPAAAYLRHILSGLTAAGYGDEAVQDVRRAASGRSPARNPV